MKRVADAVFLAYCEGVARATLAVDTAAWVTLVLCYCGTLLLSARVNLCITK
jgi:hypothetical protein